VVFLKKDKQLRLERRAGSPLLSLQQTALFGESLLAHECGKLLEWKQGVVQPFDGNLLEHVLLPDNKDLLERIDAQIDVTFRVESSSMFAFSRRAARIRKPVAKQQKRRSAQE
jgi:hypothetical protein